MIWAVPKLIISYAVVNIIIINYQSFSLLTEERSKNKKIIYLYYLNLIVSLFIFAINFYYLSLDIKYYLN